MTSCPVTSILLLCVVATAIDANNCANSYAPCNWNNWTQWGPCQSTSQIRYRHCPVNNRCIGSATESRNCAAPVYTTQKVVYTQATTAYKAPVYTTRRPTTVYKAPVYTQATTAYKAPVYTTQKVVYTQATTQYKAPVYTTQPPTTVYKAPVYTQAPTTVYKAPVYTQATTQYKAPVYSTSAPTTVYKAPVYTQAPTTVYKAPVYTQATTQYKAPVYTTEKVIYTQQYKTTTPYQIQYTTSAPSYQSTVYKQPNKYVYSTDSPDYVLDQNKVAREQPNTAAPPTGGRVALSGWTEWSSWTACGVTSKQYRTRACPFTSGCGDGSKAESRAC